MRNLLFMVCCILLATCCSKKEITQEQIAPELASSVPLNGAVEIANGMQKIELIFNQSIKIANASAIKLNDKSVEKVDVSVNTVIITVMLQPATQYELLILKEAISNTNNATLKADIRILFSTKKIVAHASELITPNSSPEVQKLFQFLKETYGQKVISGTMANVSWNIEEADWVHAQTGKYPALNCFDFIHHIYSPADWINYENTEVVEKWWRNNGIVSAMWHWCVPKDMKVNNPMEFAFYTKDTSFDISKINDPNSPEYKLMIKDIDIISGYLKLLQNKNIPVIWRPLHEAAGNTNSYVGGTGWFWWGAKGPEPCKTLWKLMFERMTNYHKLNNLIWVWTSQGNDFDWYPGDAYVDLVGRDLYPETNIHDSQLTEFNKVKTIVAGKKMIALSECGGIPDPGLMFEKGDTWLWFMPWYGDFTRDNKQNGAAYWKTVMNNVNVITRDQMPSLK
ncbi:MAG: glycosyl hydrolase [Petrimonas sp.]